MAVAERTGEIGVLRAVGASRGAVWGLVWTETVALCLAGGLAAIALALVGARAVEAWLRGKLPFAPHDALLRPEVSVVVFCLTGALVLGTLSALAPAWRAARLPPSEALRTARAA